MKPLVVRPAQDDLTGSCLCCAGGAEIRGFVYEEDDGRAIYFVESLGMPKFPLVKLGVALGAWEEAARLDDRVCYALLCKPTPEGPEMTPAEPYFAAFPELSLLGRIVAADDFALHPLVNDFHEVAKAIIDQDWRLAAIKHGEASAAPRKFSAEAG